jgi:signal transduction histidine kinase
MDVELTELVRLQEEVARSRRLASVGRLAGGIAHDFNNILAAILANAELAHSGLLGDIDCNDHLAKIELACRRGARLVARLLTFSPSEPPRSQWVDLASVVSEVVSLLDATLPQQIVIQVRLQREPHLVHADSTQVHQVLMNLISNAKHALLPKGGSIEISSSRFCVAPQSPENGLGLSEGSYWQIDVADNGAGMDEATLQRAFDPFFTTKKPGEGTGLGLSVAHGVMTSHGGAIRATSRLGQGTRFSLYFGEQPHPLVEPV